MAFSYAKLAEAIKIQDAATDILVNGSGQVKYVRSIILHNVNSNVENVSLYLVPDSGGSKGAASDTDNRFYSEALPANSTRILEFPVPGLMLTDENDAIQAKTTTDDKVLLSAFGGGE